MLGMSLCRSARYLILPTIALALLADVNVDIALDDYYHTPPYSKGRRALVKEDARHKNRADTGIDFKADTESEVFSLARPDKGSPHPFITKPHFRETDQEERYDELTEDTSPKMVSNLCDEVLASALSRITNATDMCQQLSLLAIDQLSKLVPGPRSAALAALLGPDLSIKCSKKIVEDDIKIGQIAPYARQLQTSNETVDCKKTKKAPPCAVAAEICLAMLGHRGIKTSPRRGVTTDA